MGKFRAHLPFVASALVLSMALCASPVGRTWDLFFFDLAFFIRGERPPPPDIVVVGIDELSFGVLKHAWPWPREYHAKLLDALFSAGAKAVAFDVIFAEKTDQQEDLIFRQALGRYPNVVLAIDHDVIDTDAFTQEIVVGPPEDLIAAQTRLGFVNLPTDVDGFVRRIKIKRAGYKSFAAVASELYSGKRCCDAVIGNSDSDLYINFRGPARSFKTISYYQALEPKKFLPENFLRDKLVFVGVLTKNLVHPDRRSPDHFLAPFSRWGSGHIAGVEIQANATHTLLANNGIRVMPGSQVFLIALTVTLVFSGAFILLRPVLGLVVLTVALIIVFAAIIYLFWVKGIYASAVYGMVPLTTCYLASPFSHYYTTLREKFFIQRAFSSYLAPALLEEIQKNPAALQLGGKEAEATVLFLDVAGFTSLSEKYTAKELVDIMNRFLGEITDVVLDHEGMVDKFIGDAVMAVWGIPVAREDHAIKACQSGLEIQRRISAFALRELEISGAAIDARIGLNTGSVVAGNVGGSRRFDYTVLGNAVNLSSRLEGVNKLYGTKIMIGESTAIQAGVDFAVRMVDIVRVKGKSEPERIYELQGTAASLDDAQRGCNAAYEAGFACISDRRWEEAQDWFDKGLAFKPNDGPCHALRQRCDEYKHNPPGLNWDGVYDITTK